MEEVPQASSSEWTATAKSIAVVGLALGLGFVQTFGFVYGNLGPSNVLFDESHRMQIVGIV
jgi:hypothetical protein